MKLTSCTRRESRQTKDRRLTAENELSEDLLYFLRDVESSDSLERRVEPAAQRPS
jgi:hypothetical protein